MWPDSGAETVEEKDDLIGRTVHNSYLILSLLGEGGMGRVYLANHVMISHRKFAVKVLKRELTGNPTFMKQFYDEAAHQAQLSHPNIVQMTDYFKEGDDYFLVLDYVEGRSLATIIDSLKGPMPEKEALQIFKPILSALSCAHEKVILHRDIKAENVVVDSTNRPFLLDFGIARQAGDKEAASLGRVIGTPGYMSPEQFVDSDKVDHRSDLYSAGILLFEMLTGKLPFKGNSLITLKEQHLTTPVPNPRILNPKIKKKLAEIVLKATQKDPDARFQGALEFLKAIESYQRVKSWKVWGLSLSILLASGVWYFTQHEKAIYSLATLSREKYEMFCQQAERLNTKENGLRLARELRAKVQSDIESGKVESQERSLKQVEKLTLNIEGFSQQIRELDANMEKYLDEYTASMRDLAEFRNTKVRQIFSEPEPALRPDQVEDNTVDEQERARFWKLTGEDYENFRERGESPTRKTMLKKCRP